MEETSNNQKASEIIKKIKNNTATPEEKLKFLKELNVSMEKANAMAADVIKAMEEEAKK